MTELRPVLEMQHISKRFDATQALSDVSLTLYPGEIHALLGENGAGKSTLIKIMTGIHRPDTGEILLDGAPIHIAGSAQAQVHGIAAIYQEPMVFPDLNVAENIFISHRGRGAVVNWRRMYHEAEDILAKLGVKLDVRSAARGLTLAAQQSVEIAKALSLKTRVLIMDEPTASLSAHEVTQLFKLVRILRQQGVAILFISHRLEEVFEIADRVTIFRDGTLISSAPIKDVTRESAIRDMVGRELAAFFVKEKTSRGEQLLSVRNLCRENVFSDVSFEVHRGEVLGFAGLVGARRTDVALALFGIAPATSGEIVFEGKPIRITSPGQATHLGISYVPEDRHQQGLILPMGITANITLPTLARYLVQLGLILEATAGSADGSVNRKSRYLLRMGLIRRSEETATAEKYRQQLNIRTSSLRQEASKLSGGNQQKVVLSKWLNSSPRLLILDEPTRGIDVGAKAEVHAIINELATQGLGILMISSDLPEVLAMSDRILVMREGRQMGIFSREEATQETVMTAAMGQYRQVAG